MMQQRTTIGLMNLCQYLRDCWLFEKTEQKQKPQLIQTRTCMLFKSLASKYQFLFLSH